jgi:UDP-N-acetylglucosamine 1-carboxyvinyltransferase
MDCFRIIGGRRLAGTVTASGSKNAALPIMAASLLASGPTVLGNVPGVSDVSTLLAVLKSLGVSSCRLAEDRLLLDPTGQSSNAAPARLVRRMRASICVLGPLVARRGRGVVALPGGCAIGERPIDLHLSGLESLGAAIHVERGHIVARAKRLRGTTIDWRHIAVPTVTGTANILCAASLAQGKTVIRNAAREPEIVDLGRFLIAMGARIDGLGTNTIEIAGREALDGAAYDIIPDRIEAATLLIAGAMTRGRVQVIGARDAHLSAVLELLIRMGCRVDVDANSVKVAGTDRLRAVGFMASPFPGIPTDLQAPLTALMSVAAGRSLIGDKVFPDRSKHVRQLRRIGACLTHSSGVFTREVARLDGGRMAGSDLRATASLVLAGLAAEGETVVRGIGHLDRGYQRLEEKLRHLGAEVRRVKVASSLCQVSTG